MVEIVAGKVVQLTKNVRRITAPNPGMMTGPGTNTYLVGSDQIAVIDPGPAEPSHVKAILDACDGKMAWILVTHTHPDHSPAAAVLAKETGAMLMGNVLEKNDGHQDDSFVPDQTFSHNQCLSSTEFTIRAIHTPGHVDNHICFLVEEDGLLLTGDHIMQGSTVVIIPPHGDMKDYIDSLRLLLDYPVDALGPAHGHVIDTPKEEIQHLIDHRLKRESKVVSVLSEEKTGTLDSLTPLVYDDVDSSLHPIARYSLLAHLLKLEKDQRANHIDEQWTFTN
ncbi:MAG: MBL fold metallo-hydrolase [Oceanicoccus sp.]